MITLRDATVDDAERMLEIYRYYVENTAITFEYDTPSLDEFKERIKKTKECYPYLVVVDDGKIKGYTYAGPFVNRAAYDRSCEVTIYVDRDAGKRGMGRKLYEALEQELKNMGITNMYARIGYPDKCDEYLTTNSADFHQHLGFEKVAEFHKCGYKFDRWYNVICVEKIIGEHSSQQYQAIEHPNKREVPADNKMTTQQIAAYLDRIHMAEPKEPTLEYLTELQMAHVSSIPFENLDFRRNVPVELDREHLFEKIIEGMRGGVCSEVNTLYTWLLESLGYDVVSYSSRIIAESAPIQAKSHRIMAVKINGAVYITDVGKNAENHRIPLLLEEDTEQFDGECIYKFTRDDFFGWVLWQKRPDMGWRRKLGFTEDIAVDADFIGPTMFAQYHPTSFLNKNANVSLYINGVFHALRGGYYLHEHGGIEEKICMIEDEHHEAKLLKEIFGL